MFVDVSEIKSFRKCHRQWQLSSRNSFHMTACVPPKAFHIGTVFHECLHRMYLGKDEEFIMNYIDEQMEHDDPKDKAMIISMMRGYMRNVMPQDKHFNVMDIEWHFKYNPIELLDEQGKLIAEQMGLVAQLKDITLAGSIDMITLDTDTNEIWGFEHKTAKNFRNDTYLWMDEQPRVYFAALQQWVKDYNARQYNEWNLTCMKLHDDYAKLDPKGIAFNREYPAPPEPVTLGGCYLNEVRKLVRAFDYKRSPLKYPPDDLRNFLLSFATSCAECHKYVDNPNYPRNPEPDMMTCMNCMFNTICQTFQYQNLTEDKVLNEFNLEFEKRTNDHLEEKVEVDKAGATQSK